MASKDCKHCQAINDPGKGFRIYEDSDVVAVLEGQPAGYGHVVVMPKEHYPIMEEVPDRLIGKIFSIANKISTAVFESLNAHGTNIVIQNGVAAGQTIAHFALHVIPRRENDGLNFNWQTKQLSEEELSTVELQVKEEAANIGIEKEAAKPIEVKEEKEEVTAEIEGEGGKKEESYLIKQLRRIP